jgi:hypothetical protein
MSTTTKHETTPRDRGSVDDRLARLLVTPFFTRVVPNLAPETLHRLIRYRGLDACGELVTSATPAQLAALLDLDLWRRAQPGRPGSDEQFDVERFGEWLDVLADTGDEAAARTVAALDPQLVIAGLSRYLRVFDPGTFEPTESSDDEATDRHERMNSETSADVLECEVGGYLVRSRRFDAWDSVVTLLVSLEAGHTDCFQAVMQGCRRLSNSSPEIDGLDDLLGAPEQYFHDLAAERERRQSRFGYATPADARAFLQMARRPQPDAGAPAVPSSPIATAYFRALEEDSDDPSRDAPHHDAPGVQVRGDDDSPASIEAVIELLAEAGVMPERPRALLEAAAEDARTTTLPLLTRLMDFVLHHDGTAYVTRSRELAFLANTLLAGCSVQSRPFAPQEASDAAACVCHLGLECWPSRWPGALRSRAGGTDAPPDAFLVDHSLVTAFEVGWSVLYEDVSLFAADQLGSALADLHVLDADTRRELRQFVRRLETERDAGTPWLARDAAEVLAMLDATAWIGVLGLLDECPILPAALTAVVERRTTRVSPTDFQFISTRAQLGDVRLFMRMLPGLLSR